MLNILVYGSNEKIFDKMKDRFFKDERGDDFKIICNFEEELQDIKEILLSIL